MMKTYKKLSIFIIIFILLLPISTVSTVSEDFKEDPDENIIFPRLKYGFNSVNVRFKSWSEVEKK